MELRADWLVIDEKPARRLATGLRLPVVGTLGLLLAAKRRHLISAVRPVTDALLKNAFHISPVLLESVLQDAGERA